MKKRKMISLFAAVALIGAIGIGATLAYFTDSEEKVNVVTMGHVDVDLDEPNYDGDENNEIKNLTPGQEVTKDPTITLKEGSENAYVRATLEVTGYENIKNANGETMDIEKLAFNISDKDWFLGEDGYYYYQKEMTVGDKAVLFDTVSFPESWGNEVADQSFKIIVKAEAIQADNFDPVTNEEGVIIAWKYLNGDAITAENYVAPTQ